MGPLAQEDLGLAQLHVLLGEVEGLGLGKPRADPGASAGAAAELLEVRAGELVEELYALGLKWRRLPPPRLVQPAASKRMTLEIVAKDELSLLVAAPHLAREITLYLSWNAAWSKRTGKPLLATLTASRTPPYLSCSMTRFLTSTPGRASSLGLRQRM